MALAVSEFYGVSVLCYAGLGDQVLDARLQCTNIVEAVESLAFLVGQRWRKLGEGIYLVGGSAQMKVVKDFPSYGVQGMELGASLREGVSVLGDRVVVETDQVRANQIGEMLENLGRRRALTLEVFLLDVAEGKIDRVNDWLRAVRVGGEIWGATAVPWVGISSVTQPYVGPSNSGAGVFADVQALLDFVGLETGVRIECRERVQVVSGGRSRFSSGEVLEDVTYSTVPNTTQQLVSTITRRTVGLTVELQATCWETNWFLWVTLDDSSVNAGRESTTRYEGQRIVRAGEPFFLLASFTRRARASHREGVSVLAGLPLVGKVFQRSQADTTKRNVMVIAKPLRMD